MNLLEIKPNVVRKGVSNKHFLFYGEPSTRKTSVAALFPSALILATEIGYKQIPDVKAVDIDSWARFLQVINELKKDEVKNEFKTIVIDTVGILTDLCVQYVCNLNGVKSLDEMGYGKGWTAYKTQFNRAINTISQNGYSIVFIAHSETKNDQNGNVVSIEPKIDRRPKELVVALTDFIFYLQKEKVNDKDTVIAYSQLPEGIVTKTRIRGLAPSFEFTFENIEKEINKALDKYGDLYSNDVVVEEASNKREEIVEIPFEDIRNAAIEAATKYIQDPIYKDQATELILNSMKGVPISEAPEGYRSILIDLTQALNSLA